MECHSAKLCIFNGLLVNLEAGTGIEPVYSDLQSNPFQSKINRIGGKKYQDKRRTAGEHDTLLFSDQIASEMKNPGALAGATGGMFKAGQLPGQYSAGSRL